jgi:hypothetical protein
MYYLQDDVQRHLTANIQNRIKLTQVDPYSGTSHVITWKTENSFNNKAYPLLQHLLGLLLHPPCPQAAEDLPLIAAGQGVKIDLQVYNPPLLY